MYGRRNNVLHSPNRRKRYILRLVIAVLVSALVFLGILTLFRLGKLQISKVVISGVHTLSAPALEKSVTETINQSYLWIFPKRNILFVPESYIASVLGTKYPQIQDVDFDRHFPNGLLVNITERKSLYLWCGKEFGVVDKNNCFSVDKEGFIFGDVPLFSSTTPVIFFGKPTGVVGENQPGSSPVGNYVAAARSWDQTTAALEELRTKNVLAKFVKLNDEDIVILTKPGWKLFINTNSATSTLSGAIDRVLDSEPLRQYVAADNSPLEYVDLRYGNKVFYRFR